MLLLYRLLPLSQERILQPTLPGPLLLLPRLLCSPRGCSLRRRRHRC